MPEAHAVLAVADDDKPALDPVCMCKRPHPCPVHWPELVHGVQLSLFSPTGRAIRHWPAK